MKFEIKKKDRIPTVTVRRAVFSSHESSETSSVIFESSYVILKSNSRLAWSNGAASFYQMITTNGHPIERRYFMLSKAAIN